MSAQGLLTRVYRRLRRESVRLMGWRRVEFFLGEPAGPARGELVAVDAAALERWRRNGAEIPWDDSSIRARWEQGHRLVALIVAEAPVTFAWLSDRSSLQVGELGGACELDIMATWIWDCVTPERFRRQGHYAALLRLLRAGAKDRPLVIYVDARNEPSRRGILNAGFVPWAGISRWRYGERLQLHRQPALRFRRAS